jgi:hypothetical protein
LDFPYWSARNDHFQSQNTIYFKYLSKLCEMLHISHRQTTAYHPESNGRVKRLHRRLKDVLHIHAALATWSMELPFVRRSLCAQLRGDTGLSPAVFGTPIVLPNEFLQGDEFSVDEIVKKNLETLDAPAFSLPRHNSSTQLLAELPDKLLRAPFVWLVASGGVVLPLHCPYDGPYTILQ